MSIPRTLAFCRWLGLFSLGLVSSFSLAAADPAAAAPQPRTVIMVRHAERISPEGDLGLSEKGRDRAKTLAYMLKDQRLHAVYTSQMVRTRETAEPVRAAAGIAGTVVPADKTGELVQKLRELRPGQSALVVHHSNTIPKICAELGIDIPPVAEDEFDRMLVISLPAAGKASLTTLRYGGR